MQELSPCGREGYALQHLHPCGRIPGALQQAALWGDELYSLEVVQWLFLWSVVQPAEERAVSLIKKPSVSSAISCPVLLVSWGGRCWELGAPLRWCFSVFCGPLLPSLPLQPSLSLAVGNCVVSLQACQMKQTIFCSLLERWPYQPELPQGLSQQTCYIGLAPISTHEKAVHAYTFSLKLNDLISGATVVNLVKDRCCSLMKGSSYESCLLPLNREILQGLLCPPTELIDDYMIEAS